jgi:hypothetical protein
MGMRRESSPFVEAMLASRQEAARRAVRSIRIVALPESSQPSAARLLGWQGVDDTVTSVDLEYGDPRAGGPWVVVMTARWGGTRVDAGPLRWLLEHHMRRQAHRFSNVPWRDSNTTMIVDGQPVAGQLIRAGDQWWAARCNSGNFEISVVARDWSPDSIAVDTVNDVEPLLARSAWEMPTPPSAVTQVIGASTATAGRDPLRALVDAHLQHAKDRREWWADGGPPPTFPPHDSTLWRAAVRRYVGLTDRPERQAGDEVSSLVSHLGNLYHNASWFRDNARLRERAIAETLLFGTGLSEHVSSGRAQQAWQRKHGHPAPADVEGFGAVEQEWLDEWAAWAAGHAAN